MQYLQYTSAVLLCGLTSEIGWGQHHACLQYGKVKCPNRGSIRLPCVSKSGNVRTVNIVYLFGSSCHSPRNYRATNRNILCRTCTRNSNHADFALPNPAQTWQDCNQLNENHYSTLQSPALCAGQKGQGRRPAEGLSLPYAAPPLFKAFTLVTTTTKISAP